VLEIVAFREPGRTPCKEATSSEVGRWHGTAGKRSLSMLCSC